MIIQDNVLTRWDELRAYADTATFGDYQNGPDGVVYPNICTDLPDGVEADVRAFVEAATGEKPADALVFMRASPAGVVAPHQAHSDELMGRWSVMIYMNRREHCQGGTSMLRHRQTGMQRSPADDDHVAAWERDTNDPSAWEVLEMARMAPNRGCVFASMRMHRAEPVGGFGTTNRDARLVLTGFLS